MTHLSPAELVDLVEGSLAASREAHAAACETCRAAAADARATIARAVEAAPGVEPSPLFWQELSARVARAIEAEPARAWWQLTPRTLRWLAPAAAALIVIGIVAAPLLKRPVTAPVEIAATGPSASAPPLADADADVSLTFDANTSEIWEVLTAAAADLEWDAAHDAGIVVPSAAVDRAVQRLSADELNELGRLLQRELKRAGN